MKGLRRICKLTFLFCLMTAGVMAQKNMRIAYKDGTVQHIDVSRIDSITFVDAAAVPTPEATLTGGWLWAKKERGYYELLTFNSDKTFTGYDYYFDYGFPTQTYGTYMYNGSMLWLHSNAIGYFFNYRWFLLGLTSNALDVMTENGRFTYYRLQPDVIRLKVGGTPLACAENEEYTFTDDVYVKVDNGRLKALQTGKTYIQKTNTATNTTLSYQVTIE